MLPPPHDAVAIVAIAASPIMTIFLMNTSDRSRSVSGSARGGPRFSAG
jgi:hypothetical protein